MMFSLRLAPALGECNLRTFKTSRVIINQEMYEKVLTISMAIIHSTKLLHRWVSIATSVLRSTDHLDCGCYHGNISSNDRQIYSYFLPKFFNIYSFLR